MAYLTYSVPIIGVSFHNAPHLWPELRGNASASLVKPRLLTGHFDLRLVAEPDNPADASAIRVDLAAHELADGQARTLGYIPRSHTTQVGLLLTEAVVLAPGLPDPQLLKKPSQGALWDARLETDKMQSNLREGPMADALTFTDQLRQPTPTRRHPRGKGSSCGIDSIWF